MIQLTLFPDDGNCRELRFYSTDGPINNHRPSITWSELPTTKSIKLSFYGCKVSLRCCNAELYVTVDHEYSLRLAASSVTKLMFNQCDVVGLHNARLACPTAKLWALACNLTRSRATNSTPVFHLYWSSDLINGTSDPEW